MRSQGARAKITAVDDKYPRSVAHSYEPSSVSESQRIDFFDERTLRTHVRRERSSAYWFAATKWGMLGLILGMIIGGFGMYVASVAAIPMAQDAMTRAAAINDARDRAGEQGATNFTLPR